MASNHVQGEALRAWQLALRSNRKQPDFFQVGGKLVGAKTEEGPSPKKEMKQKRGRPPRRGGSAGQPLAVSSQVSPSCSPVSSPSKQGGKKSKPELMVIEEGDDIPVEHEPLFGRVVWAQFGSFRSYHPALVIKGSLVNLATPDNTQAFVFWFSDRKVSAVPREKLLDFVPFFKERAVHCHGKQGQQGILKAIEELQRQAESSGHSLMDMDPLHWAHMGFPTRDNADLRMFRPGPDFHFPESILERLADIGAEIREKASLKDRDIPNEFHDESAITAVWQGTKNISDVCIGCGDWDRKILCPHPLFKGGLCCKCKDSLQETFYAVGDDGTHSFCAVCGAGGQLFVCDTPSCGRVFCVPCVEELGGEDVLKKVQEARTWPCFLCQPFQSSSHGLLTPLPDWRENLVLFFDMGHRTSVVPDLEYFKTRRPIRVLSLFDGIGTGLLALKRAGFQVEVYYASETDGQATIICQANHSQAVTQLGDVTKITTDMLAEIAPIDLLMGGSPCNELSLANPLRKGFDVEGSGVLFFDFYRVLRDLQALNSSTHLFWLYENVASMRCAYRAVISRFLQCQPAVWDAKHLSAQKRSRFFWGNIPGLYSTPEVSEALRQEVDLNSVLTRQCGRQANVQRVRTVTTQTNSLLQGPQHSTLPVTMAGSLHTLWLSELERLFGFPTHYTDVGNLPPTKRRALLGRSWSVQVITEILRPLSQYFATASNDDSHRGSTPTREANSDTVVTASTATHIETFVTKNCDTSESDGTATHVAASLTNNSDTKETDQTTTAITETDQTATAITETDQTATAVTETDQTATAITTSAANHGDTNSDNISTRVATSWSRGSDNADSGIATGAMATTTTPYVHMAPGERITTISAVTTVSYSDTTNTTSAFSCSNTTNTASAISYSDTTNTVPAVTPISYSDTTNTVPAISAISYSDTKNTVPAISTVSYSDTTNTASAISYSDTANTFPVVTTVSYSDTTSTIPAICTVSYSDTTNTASAISAISYSDTKNTIPAISTVSYSDTTNVSAVSFSDTMNNVSTVSFSDTINTVSVVSFSDTTNVSTVSYNDTKNIISTVSYSDTTNTIPAVSYSSTHSDAGELNPSRADKSTRSSTRSDTGGINSARADKPTGSSTRSDACELNSALADKPTRRSTRTSAVKGRCALTDDVEHSSVPTDRADRSSPVAGPLTRSCTRIDTVERSAPVTGKTPKHSFTFTDTVKRGSTRCVTLSKRRSGRSGITEHSNHITSRVRCSSCHTEPSKSSSRATAVKSSSPATAVEASSRATAVKSSPDAGAVRCSAHASAVTSSSDTNAVKSNSDINAVRSNSDVNAVKSRSDSNAVKSRSNANAVVSRSDASAVKSRSGTNVVKSSSDASTVESGSDVNTVESNSDANAVKSSSDANAVTSGSDANAVKSSSDANAVESSFDTYTVVSSSDINAVKSSSDASGIQFSSDANAVKSSSETTAVKSSSDANAVKSSSDTTAVKSSSDANSAKSSPDACTVKCRSRANAARFSSSRAITGRTRRRAADTSKIRRGAADTSKTRRGAADMSRTRRRAADTGGTRHRASDMGRTRRGATDTGRTIHGAADMEKAGRRGADTGRPRHRTGAWSVAGGSVTVPENDNKADPVQVVSLPDSVIVTPDPGRAVAWKVSATGSDDLDINPAGPFPSAGVGPAAHSGTVLEPARLLTGNPPDRQNNDSVSTVIDEPTTTSDSQTGEVTAVGCSENTMGDVTADSSTLFAFIFATGHGNSGHSPVSGVRESEVLPTGVRSDKCRGLSGIAAADPQSAVRTENVHQPVLFPVGTEGSIPVEASGLCPSEDLEKGFDVFQLSNIDLDVEPGFDNEEEHDEYPDTNKCVERFVDSIAHLPDNNELPCSNEDVVSATDPNGRVASNPMHQEEVSALEEIISAGSTAEDDQSYLTTSDIEEKLLCSSDDDDHFVAVGILTRALRPRPSSSPPASVTAVEALTPHETTTTTTTINSERHGPAQDVLEVQGDSTASGEGRTSVTGSRVSDQGDASQRHHNPTHDSKRETLISVNKTATGSDDTTDCLATSASAAERPSLDAEALPTSNRSPRELGQATKQSISTCPSDGATNTNPCMRLEPRDGYLVLQRYTESKRAEASSILGSILEAGAGTSGSVSHQLDQPDASAGAGLSARKEGGNSGRLEGRQGRCTFSLGDGVTLAVELHDDRQDTQRSGWEVKDAGLCPDGAPGGAGNPPTTEVGRETFGESCVTGPGVSTEPDCMRTKARICSEPCQTYSASVQMCPKTRGRTEATTAETATPCSGQKSVEEDVSVLETRVTRAMSRGRVGKLQSKRRESCTHSADSRSSCGPSVRRSGRPQTTTAARPKSRTVEMSKSHFTPPGAVSEATYDVEPRRSRGVHMPRDPPICSVATDAEDANETLTVAVDQISMARKMAFAADVASRSGISTTRSVNVCAESSSMNVSQKVSTIDKTKKAETSRKGPFQPENANRGACRTTTRAWCDGRLRHRSSGTEKAKGKAATLPVVDQRERNQQPSDEAPSLSVTSNETAASLSSSPYITPRQEHRDKLRLTGDNANGLASVGGGACCSQVSAQHQATAGVPSPDRGCKSQLMAENDDFRKHTSKTRKTSNANRHSGDHRSGRKRSLSWNVRTPRDRNDPDVSRSSSDADPKTSLDNACSQDQNRRLRKRTRLQGPSINICSTADEDRMDTCPVKAASPVNQAWQRGASTSISSTADGNWIDSCSVKANSLMTQTGQRRASANTADGHEIDRCEVKANCPVAQTWQPRSSTSISSTADKNRNDGCQVKANSPGTQTRHRQKLAREGDHAAQWQEREMRPTQTTPPEDHRQKRCPRKMAPRECPPPGERRLRRKRKAVGGRVPGNQKFRLRAGHSTYTGSGDRSSSQ